MAKQQKDAPAPVADEEGIVDLPDEEIDLERELAEAAKDEGENPDLFAFLTGGAQPTEEGDRAPVRKVTLFLGDTRPYAQKRQELADITFRYDRLVESLAKADPTDDPEGFKVATAQAESVGEDLATLRDEVEKLKAGLFKRALVVGLRKPYRVEIDKAERRARKATPGRRNNEEATARYNSIMAIEVLARALVSITLPGNIDGMVGKRLASARMLANLLAVGQWNTLVEEMNDITYADGAKTIALQDPGFLAES